ncbi:phage tail tape measure protein [Peptostreptococcus faecalis]|uniref:phage tail tape measure protein n=1 Tax=Peptostreptococcus faecalis TaxID=2045015 RepID=UPI000C7A2DC2|nr:phage tail tape measure protein [Peptostreptococcus faecalis]
MAEFRIKSTLDLSTDEAKSKMKALENEKIKAKLELDAESSKKALNSLDKASKQSQQNRVKDAKKAENELAGIDRKKLNEYKRLGQEKASLSNKFAKAESDNARKNLDKNIRDRQRQMSGLYKQMSSEQQKIAKQMDTQMFGAKSGNGLLKAFGRIDKDALKIKNTIRSLDGDITKTLGNKLSKQMDGFYKGLDKKPVNNATYENARRTMNSYQQSAKALKEISSLEKSYGSRQTAVNNRLGGLSNLVTQKAGAELNKNLSQSFSQIRGKDITSTASKMKVFGTELNRTATASKQLQGLDKTINRLSGLESGLKPKTINGLRQGIVDLSKSPSLGTASFDSELKKVNTQMTVASRYQGRMAKLKDDFKMSMFGTSMGYLAGSFLRSQVTGAIQTFKDLDASMTDIKKVANPRDVATESQTKAIRKQAIQIAKDVGMASSDVQSSIATALQSGMGGMKESMAVARKSMILANVGDMDKVEATKAVNTIVKSFNLDPLGKQRVNVKGMSKETTQLANAMDLLNYAGNNYAISSAGVAEALQRGGGVMKAYGMNLADSVAMITATNEPIQNPEKVGNGLKSIAINMAGITTSAKDGTLHANKTAKALQEIAGVDIYKDKAKGSLKSQVELLDEVQKKWGGLNDAQRAGLSESIAGKHRADIFQALMGNYETFKKLRNEFSQGDHFGSAEAENEKYVNSLAGKTNKLKETMTSIGTGLINGKAVY